MALMLCAAGIAVALAAPASAGAKRTYFSGTEQQTIGSYGTWIADGSKLYISGGTLFSTRDATDPRVSGQATINLAAIWDAATWTGPMWGTFHVENSDGAWDGYWQGARTLSGQDVHSHMFATAAGSGAYQGLVARWTYTGVNVHQTGVLDFTGFIVEAKGGPGERPFRVSATRTERLEMHPGVVVMPPTNEQAMAVTFHIVEESGQATHLGRIQNAGTGLLLPTGGVSGYGSATAANGALLYWIVEGTVDPATGIASIVLHFAGGTGAFEAAVGTLEGAVSAQWEPTEDPLVLESHFSYTAAGTIRY
jgi:hypothetical protein